jgi:hypothetical protein
VSFACPAEAMNSAWTNDLHDELLRLRQPGPGWGNRPGGAGYVEPTALAALALIASEEPDSGIESRKAVAQAADWLRRLQQPDGGLGLAPDLPNPRWTTPLAILLWSATVRGSDSRDCEARDRAVKWLLAQRGTTWEPTGESPYGHDPRIAGWAWVDATHSWLEPTATAVLALRRSGLGDHVRTRDGQRLIRDRAIRSGGWNYGNSAVFGADLRPQPAPTGMALLALTGVEDFDSPLVEHGCEYLEAILPTTRAPQSLCFGTLALTAWDRRPSDADAWLMAAHPGAARRSNSISQLAYLLLAAGTRSLALLGVGT